MSKVHLTFSKIEDLRDFLADPAAHQNTIELKLELKFNLATEPSETIGLLSQFRQLQSLEFIRISISKNPYSMGALALASVLPQIAKLKKLTLRGQSINRYETKALLRAFKDCRTLTDLGFLENEMGLTEAREIAAYLREDQKLTHLNLSDNFTIYYPHEWLQEWDGNQYKRGALAVNEILNSLHQNTTLTHLNLAGNLLLGNPDPDLVEATDQALIDFLRLNKGVKQLNLRNNYLGNYSHEKSLLNQNLNFPQSLKYNQTLNRLFLDHNDFSSQMIVNILEGVGESSIHDLTFTTDTFVERDQDTLSSEIIHFLKTNRTLTGLILDNTHSRSYEWAEFFSALQLNPTLKRLSLRNAELSIESIQAMAKALKNHNPLTHLGLYDGKLLE